jgi:hypothetical protein
MTDEWSTASSEAVMRWPFAGHIAAQAICPFDVRLDGIARRTPEPVSLEASVVERARLG